MTPVDNDDRRFYEGSRLAARLPRRLRVWLGGWLWHLGSRLSSLGQSIMPDHVWVRAEGGGLGCEYCELWASEDSGYPCNEWRK